MTTRSEGEGAASAAPSIVPATPEEARDLLDQATKPEQVAAIRDLAEAREREHTDLADRWGEVKLRAEWLYGKLLPPKQQGKRTDLNPTSDKLSEVQRKRNDRARKVAEVPEEKLDEYIASTDKPTREGLLREHGPKKEAPVPTPEYTHAARWNDEPTLRGKPSLSHDPDVVVWVRNMIRNGHDREQIVRASRENTHGWPRPGRNLTNGGVSEVRSAIAALENTGLQAKIPRVSTRILADLERNWRKGEDERLFLFRIRIMEAVRLLEGFDTEEYVKVCTDWALGEVHGDLTLLSRWTDEALAVVAAAMSDLGRRKTLEKLRATAAEGSGATEAERATATRLADKLERKGLG